MNTKLKVHSSLRGYEQLSINKYARHLAACKAQNVAFLLLTHCWLGVRRVRRMEKN
jgi:hypothetical protein